QRPGEVRGLGRDVEASGEPVAGERLLALETIADGGQHRHLPVGPDDALHPLGGESEILDVVLCGDCHGFPSFRPKGTRTFAGDSNSVMFLNSLKRSAISSSASRWRRPPPRSSTQNDAITDP